MKAQQDTTTAVRPHDVSVFTNAAKSLFKVLKKVAKHNRKHNVKVTGKSYVKDIDLK